jgi:hypothetical protein
MSAYKGLRIMLDNVASKKNGEGNLYSVHQTDIEDFFPSVTEEQVREEVYHFLYRILHRWKKGPKLSVEMVNNLADLITELCCFKGRLPQGAPTSPILANMAAKHFDQTIVQALDKPFEYGRYADDIVIMGVETLPEDQRAIVRKVLNASGFRVADQKTMYQEGRGRYTIWGVDVFPANTAQGVGLRFKLPVRLEREWAKEIMEAIHNDDFPKDPVAFLNDKRIKKILGQLSHAYHVTKFGKAERKKIHRLPPKLAHAWGKFCAKFKDRLPKKHGAWFMNETLQYVDVKNHIEATPEIFKNRQKRICERGDFNHEKFQEELERKKAEVMELARQCEQEEIYLDIELGRKFSESVEDFKNRFKDMKSEEADQLILQNLMDLIAFVELSFEGKFKDMERDKKNESLLTEELQYIWTEDFWPAFLDYLEHTTSNLKGLKYLFWDQEVVKEKELRDRDVKPKKVKKPYLFLRGFKKKKQ